MLGSFCLGLGQTPTPPAASVFGSGASRCSEAGAVQRTGPRACSRRMADTAGTARVTAARAGQAARCLAPCRAGGFRTLAETCSRLPGRPTSSRGGEAWFVTRHELGGAERQGRAGRWPQETSWGALPQTALPCSPRTPLAFGGGKHGRARESILDRGRVDIRTLPGLCAAAANPMLARRQPPSTPPRCDNDRTARVRRT